MAPPTARLELRLYPADEDALDRLIALLPPGSTRTSAIRTAVAEALDRRERRAERLASAENSKKHAAL
jgi:hypothetical protein